ncbi:helix-turn-helix domain-containing protein [Mycobacterium sp. 852002-30065_SCH5024008]|uniref:helix-turn-helix domain-containing protein n=1 Tax=Mycobacterium sp. 852002-30065_SCH5024008 TaxID=1834088 RepID=UPI0009EDD63D|nr:helix-turn-helix domain-containing protein [Mycobacterium sp. 852002-30065_SCH5024008]
MASPPLSRALSAREVQEALGLDCIETVWRLIRRGELPAAKVGRIWRVRREAVEAYLAGKSPHAAVLDDYVERLVEQAPSLSDEQRAKLAELLRPARQRPGAIA